MITRRRSILHDFGQRRPENSFAPRLARARDCPGSISSATLNILPWRDFVIRP